MDDLPLDAASFRRVSARYATGIAVVTTVVDGVDHAMTANSFTSVSLEPLQVLVCVQRDTRFHEAVTRSGVWAASLLAAGQEPLAKWFATRGRPLAEQFRGIGTTRGQSGALVLTDAIAALQAHTVATIAAGDHDILLGEVSALHLAEHLPDPLLYFASAYRRLSPR